MSIDLSSASANDIADAVRRGDLRATEAVEHHLRRIEKLNEPIGAYVFVDPERALADAAAIDDRVAAGEDPGPLAGVPLAVKVTDTVGGWPATKACTVFKDEVAAADSVHIARLRAAGAVPVGLTASPPMGLLSYTASALYGTCRNPWNLERTPGGSSGGAAAALSAGLAPLATGSDMGGSIRNPAAFTGVVGVKGTYGRIPRGPGYLGTSNLVHVGPLARTVRDAARYLDVAAGPSEWDPASSVNPVASFEDACDELSVDGLRVAWVRDLGGAVADPAVEAVVKAAADALIATGLDERSVRIDLPGGADFGISAVSALVTADRSPEPEMAGKTSEVFADLAATPGAMSVVQLLVGGSTGAGNAGARARLVDAVFSRPALMRAAMAVAERVPGLVGGGSLDKVVAGQHHRHFVNQALAAAFDDVDVLLLPTMPYVAFGAEGPIPTRIGGRDVGLGAGGPFTAPFNVSGHPAVSVPAGTVDGLPVGLQIVCRRHEDHVALALAARYESIRPWPLLAPGY